MKKYVFFVCLISIIGCSKNEAILSAPSITEEDSHISNYDLSLVDGLIQLKISKEEALSRGVSASEYDLVEETLIKHNNSKVRTRSMNNNTLAWGILEDPSNVSHSNSFGPFYFSFTPYAGTLTLSYSMSSTNDSSSNLQHFLFGSNTYDGTVFGNGFTQGTVPFFAFWEGSINLNYYILGTGQGICVYEVYY